MDSPSTSKEHLVPVVFVENINSKFKTPNKAKKNEDNSKSCFLNSLEINKENDDVNEISDDEFEEITPLVKSEFILPCCNCQEKIILVVDRAHDENFTHFELNNNSVRPLPMILRTIELFLHLKQRINQKHEYSLMFINENSASWDVNFTNNIKNIKDHLKNTKECDAEDIFNMDTIFEIILEKVQVPEIEDVDRLRMPPPFVVRTILFYGRSYTVPKLKKSKHIKKLLDSPYFTLDIIMTHEPEDEDNNCNKIFKALQNIDKKGRSYFFPVARNSKSLHSSIAKLLGHPLQRPVQKEANYKIDTYYEKFLKAQD